MALVTDREAPDSRSRRSSRGPLGLSRGVAAVIRLLVVLLLEAVDLCLDPLERFLSEPREIGLARGSHVGERPMVFAGSEARKAAVGCAPTRSVSSHGSES